MKKFLSLVLALVMTMSLVTISAGAKDFTDDDAIKYEEAIDVMSAVKVIDGYTDGSFKPQTQLNRGQAAKIICNMVLGPTTASALKADAAPFKDVAADNTFAGYIAYCVQAGLIDGYTDGTYKPTAPLTGYAFMKYLLGVLGYDKDVEGYNGANWSINVAKQALAVGLDSGLAEDFDGTKIVTREEACLFAFNAMKATVVEYSDKTEVSAGGVTVTTTGNRYELDNNSIYPDKLGKTGLQFAEKYFKNLRCSDGRDDFGRPVTTWTLKTEKVGTYVNYDQKIGEYTSKVKVSDLYELVGSTAAKHTVSVPADLHVYMNGVDSTEDSSADKNGATKTPLEQVGLDVNPFSLSAVKRNSTKVGGTGVKTEVYVDNSGANPVVSIVSYATYLYQASEDYNAKQENVRIAAAGDTNWLLNNAKAKDVLYADDFDIADVKADDYLLVTMAYVGGAWNIKSVAPAESVTGVVNTYSQDGSKATVGGEERSYAFATYSTSPDTQLTNFTVGQDAKVILDAYGNIIGVAEAVVNANYVYIKDSATTTSLNTSVVASAYFTDGTSDEITLKEAMGNTSATLAGLVRPTSDPTQIKGWYTFSKNTAGKYTLTAVEPKFVYGNGADTNRNNDLFNITKSLPANTNDVLKSNTVQFLANAGVTDVYADNNTVFVILDANDTVSTYTGIKNVPTISTGVGDTASVTYVKKANNGGIATSAYAGYVFVDLSHAPLAQKSNSTNSLLYVVKYDGKTWIDDMNTYHTYKVLDENANETSVKVNDTTAAALTTGDVYKLYKEPNVDGDGYLTITGTNAVVGAPGTKYISGSFTTVSDVVTQSGDTISVNGNQFVLAEDAKIILVVKKSANALNSDKGAAYEADVLSARSLAATVKGYDCTGHFEGVKTDSTGNVLQTLYVTVTGATVTPPAP